MYDRYMPYLANNKMLDLTYKKLKSLESPQIGYLKLNTYRHDTRSPISNAFVRVSKLTISGYYREIGTGVFWLQILQMKMVRFQFLNFPY